MRTTKTSTLSMLAACVLAATACGAQAADVKVNGVTIPQYRFDLLLKQTTQHQQQKDTPDLRNAIRDRLIDYEIMSQEAVNKGLDKNPDIAAALDMQKQQLLVQAFAQDYVKNHPISEDMLKQEYDRRKTQMTGQKEYKVRHLDLKTEQEAKTVIEQLKKGTSWEKIAKEKSQDPNGDWLPESTPPNQVPEAFMQAVKSLKKGGTTDKPVQTPFGWHVIRVDDVRPVSIPSYDVAKPQIQQLLENAELKKALDDLRAKAKIEQ